MELRPEADGDRPGIRRVLEEAFGQPDEADLVDSLRAEGDLVLSVVAVEGPRITGSIVFSRMAAPFHALALAPVAVSPDLQGRGIGTRLIRAGIARATEAGWEGVFVLGDPGYYARFGFEADAAARFRSPFAGPHLMVLPLRGALPRAEGEIAHATALARLG